MAEKSLILDATHPLILSYKLYINIKTTKVRGLADFVTVMIGFCFALH